MSDRFSEVIGHYGPKFQSEFALTPVQCAGSFGGNCGWESGEFRFFKEVGSGPNSGGRGWGMWTGARRIAFLGYCKAHRLDPTSDEASFGYLCFELHGTYRSVIVALKRCQTVEAATQTFERLYERAGRPAMSGRIALARRALAILQPGHPASVAPAPKRAAPMAKKARPVARRHTGHHHG